VALRFLQVDVVALVRLDHLDLGELPASGPEEPFQRFGWLPFGVEGCSFGWSAEFLRRVSLNPAYATDHHDEPSWCAKGFYLGNVEVGVAEKLFGFLTELCDSPIEIRGGQFLGANLNKKIRGLAVGCRL